MAATVCVRQSGDRPLLHSRAIGAWCTPISTSFIAARMPIWSLATGVSRSSLRLAVTTPSIVASTPFGLMPPNDSYSMTAAL